MAPFLSRREILRVGALGAGGFASLPLARALELRERFPLAAASARKPASAAILIWLDGGASHIDTFDLKPRAPEEIRGEFEAIETPVPGVLFARGLERIAASLPRFALVRSVCSDAGEHDVARHLLLTGNPFSPSLEYPTFGSVVSRTLEAERFPPYLYVSPVLRNVRHLGAGFLPPEHEPFAIESDPNHPSFAVRDLSAPEGVSADLVARRDALRRAFDGFRKTVETSEAVRARTSAFDRAVRLVASKEAREAFDLSHESPETRERYGATPIGQSCLLARRLVEAGARFVTVNDGSWDTHAKCQEHLAVHRFPKLDRALPALLEDLHERGLGDEVLVVMMGEFGRTPKINVNEGRDHWPRAGFAIFAGAGIKGGTVLGATDERAENVVERPVSPADLAATIYSRLGIDPAAELVADGRPVRLVKDGEPIGEILA